METTDTLRFSESPLWAWQRKYYETQGIKAWQQQQVPHHITCSSTMAAAYADIVFAFIRERAKKEPGNSEVIYLFEAGAGSGKLAFRFLNHLQQLYRESAEPLPPYCYVLSDLARGNVDFWKSHAGLQPFIQAGVLDVARFDAVNDNTLFLEMAGKTITPGNLAQPLVIIANYFFDSIPQDLFYLSSGTLNEVRVRISQPPAPEPENVFALQPGLQLTYSIQPVTAPFYPETSFNALLENYTATLEETHLFFPHSAIRCLQNLGALSQQGFLLLTADKGEHDAARLDGCDLPVPDQHGSFSLPVNYHAICSAFEMQGAKTFSAAFPYTFINTLALLHVTGAGHYPETAAACRRMLEKSPDDFHHLQAAFFDAITTATAAQIIAYLKLNGCDSDLLQRCLPRLTQLAEHLQPAEQTALVQVCTRAQETHYPLGENGDFYFQLGILLYFAAQFKEALHCFLKCQSGQKTAEKQTATETNVPLLFNLASCYFQLDEVAEAHAYARMVLELEPGHAGAGFILGEG